MGRDVIAANARRLLKDAELLCAADRFASAAALAIISIEEVGKIIFDILDGPINGVPPAWHLKKQKYVGVVIVSQVCSLAIGKEIILPRSDEETKIELDDELAQLLFEVRDEPGTGERLGRYLWVKSSGRVNETEIRQCAEYEQWLMTGYLNSIKNAALYTDFGGGARISIDEQTSRKIINLARYSVLMCSRL